MLGYWYFCAMKETNLDLHVDYTSLKQEASLKINRIEALILDYIGQMITTGAWSETLSRAYTTHQPIITLALNRVLFLEN